MAIHGQLLSLFKTVFVTVISSLFFCYWLVQLSLFNVLQPYYVDKFEITNYGLFFLELSYDKSRDVFACRYYY